jgi:hypothetical protein
MAEVTGSAGGGAPSWPLGEDPVQAPLKAAPGVREVWRGGLGSGCG